MDTIFHVKAFKLIACKVNYFFLIRKMKSLGEKARLLVFENKSYLVN